MQKEIKVFDKTQLREKIGVIVGTRPGIVMFAPIIHELRRKKIKHMVIHTGQHYSPNMDSQFFTDMGLSIPDFKIDGVSEKKTHGAQTAKMLEGIEAILIKERPKIVLVGGDANTNLAGALAARKLQISVGHIEAGERSFDWRMPEEHNRRIIDHISDYLFATNEKGKDNLLREMVQGKIYIVGNPIVDASLKHLDIAKYTSIIIDELHLNPGRYGVMTTHREENVDCRDILKGTLEGVSQAAVQLGMPIIFFAHPRTLKRLKEFDIWHWAHSLEGIRIHEGVGYLDFLNVLAHSYIVFTDSGGVQQEACIHHIPTVTLRENTEWVETLEYGANRLAGTDPNKIVESAKEAIKVKRKWPVPFGDGTSSKQIVQICEQILGGI